MRPVNKGVMLIKFKKYESARRYLIDKIGEYCSYCERKLPAAIAVEHVKPKSTNKNMELS